MKKGITKNGRYIVRYRIYNLEVWEEHSESGITFKYDLLSESRERVFKASLLSNSRRDYEIEIKSHDLMFLKKIGWL